MNAKSFAVLLGFVVIAWGISASSDASPYDDPNGNTHVVCQADATQSYELYIPHSAPATNSPILYGFDPGGDGKGTLVGMASAASANGWILAVSNNSKNGPWQDIFNAQDAVLADTEARLSLHPTRRFAAGMSGGARTSLALAFRYPAKICAVLCMGAGWPVNTTLVPSTDSLLVSIFIGTQDSNYTYDIPSTQGQLISYDIRCKIQTFDGGHVWPPADMLLAGFQWLNANAQLDPNAGLTAPSCPNESLFCQKALEPNDSWHGYVSDTLDGYSVFEDFTGIQAPITRVLWWGVTASYFYDGDYNESYWLPEFPTSDTFTVSFYPDRGGLPGAAVHEETVTAVRTDLPIFYTNNYRLRQYQVQLSAPVTLESGWVSVKHISDSDYSFLWLTSKTGNSRSLQYSDANKTYAVNPKDLAVCLSEEPFTLDFGANSYWGTPPLMVKFTGAVTGAGQDSVDWRWDFGDGAVLDGQNGAPLHVYSGLGTHTVSLTATTIHHSLTVTKKNMIVVGRKLPLSTRVTLIGLITAFFAGGITLRNRRRQ